MKPVTKIFIIATVVLTTLISFNFYLLDIIDLGIPKLIPFTPIGTYGVSFFAIVLAVYAIVGQKVLKWDPAVSVSRLTVVLATIGVISDMLFRLVKLVWFVFDGVAILRTVAVLSIYYVSIAFLTSFQLITKHTKRTWLYVIILIILANIIIRWVLPILG